MTLYPPERSDASYGMAIQILDEATFARFEIERACTLAQKLQSS